ncbi:MAG: hypothetical protein AAB470_01090 [Patescibacteria group bacterium]
MSDLKNREFLLPIPRELKIKLENKRKEYLEWIGQPNCAWVSWQQSDLICRHNSDPDFRLLYYKFVIISTVLIANEKYEVRKSAGTNSMPNTVDSRLIGFDLSRSLGRAVVSEEFESACEVIDNYVTGKEQLN